MLRSRAQVAGDWCDTARATLPARRHCGTPGTGALAGHRGPGLGRMLLEATWAEAQGRGFPRVGRPVRVGSEAATALYERRGFRTEGVLVRHMLVDGAFEDTLSRAILPG